MGKAAVAVAGVLLCALLALSAGGPQVVALLGEFVLVLFVIGGIIAGICALAQRASRSDVHEHTGTVRLEHTGTIRHEVAGTVEHTVRHVGNVTHTHVHQLGPRDRARLDALAAQQALEEAEMAQLQRAELRRKLDEVELQRIQSTQRRELTAGPDGVYR